MLMSDGPSLKKNSVENPIGYSLFCYASLYA
jgi:hypothetical protein